MGVSQGETSAFKRTGRGLRTRVSGNPGILRKVVLEGLEGFPIPVIQSEVAIELWEGSQLSLSPSVMIWTNRDMRKQHEHFPIVFVARSVSC